MIKLIKFICLFIFCILICDDVVFADKKFDYCTLEDGAKCRKHIGCRDIIVDPAEESAESIVKFQAASKTKFINFLNRKQNDFALGRFDNEKAANLSVIVWDNDLEDVAGLAAWKLGRFQFASDYCYDTANKKNTEYNLDEFGRGIGITEIINEEIKLYNERVNSRLRLGKKFFNFAYIGCIYAHYGDNNFSGRDGEIRCVIQNQFDRYSSYVKGEPCSMCRTACDTEYTGLCQTSTGNVGVKI